MSCSLSDQIAANHNASTDVQDQLELLLDDPGLLPNAVDEANRLSSPVQFAFREATEDNQIANGEVVSANASGLRRWPARAA